MRQVGGARTAGETKDLQPRKKKGLWGVSKEPHRPFLRKTDIPLEKNPNKTTLDLGMNWFTFS